MKGDTGFTSLPLRRVCVAGMRFHELLSGKTMTRIKATKSASNHLLRTTHPRSPSALPILGFLLVAVLPQGYADEWSQFRGSNSDGRAAADFPDEWSDTQNVRWKVALPGEGWACPIVWGNRVIIAAAIPAEQNVSPAAFRPEQYQGGGGRRRSDLTEREYRWDVFCFDAETGDKLWQTTAKTGKPPIPRHSSNTFATETPVTDGERIYVYFGMNGLFCFDMDGELQWEKDLGTYEMRAGWGTSSSPVLLDDKLFLQIDNEQQSFIVALDALSGEESWKVLREEGSQYGSPIIWKNSLRHELIAGGTFFRSYDPDTGELLWQLDMDKGRCSASPLAVGDRLYVGTQFRDRGGPDDGGGFMFAIKPGGKGDITPTAGERSNGSVVWKLADSGIKAASPVLCNNHLYLLDRNSSILSCIDAETGKLAYRKRIPKARSFWSSPWTHDGKVYCLDDAGTTHVLAGGPEFRVLGRNELGEQTWSSPAIANGALFIRSAQHLYCIAE